MINILNIDFKNINFFHFLLILLPVLLVSGPLLPDLIVTIISFYFIFVFYIKKDFKVTNSIKIFVKFFLIFYIIAIISSINSIEPMVSLRSSVPYIRFLFFVLGTYYLLKNNLNIINVMSFVLIVMIFFLSIDATSQYFFEESLFGFGSMGNRPSSLFGSELILGSYVARLFPIGFIYIFSLTDKNKKILFILYFIICLLAIIVSQERTAFIQFIFAHFLFFLLIKDVRKIYSYLFFITSIFIFVFSLTSTTIFDRLITHTLNQGVKGNHMYLYSERHTDHILTAINMIKVKPLIGHGNKSFRFLCDKPQYSTENLINDRQNFYSKTDQLVTLEMLTPGNGNLQFSKEIRDYPFWQIAEIYFPFEMKIKKEDVKIAETKWIAGIKETKDIKDILSSVYNTSKEKEEKVGEMILYHTNEIKEQANILSTEGILSISSGKNVHQLFYIDNTTNIQKRINTSIMLHLPTFKYNLKKGEKILKLAYDHKNGCNTHPHHLFIQVFSENGLLNFAIIVLLLVSIIFILIKENKNKNKNIKNYNTKCALLVMGLITLFPLVPSGNFFNNWLSIAYYLPVGLYFVISKKID